MFIGICGSICSGRRTVAQYLVEHHGFKYVYTEASCPAQDGHEPAANGATEDDLHLTVQALSAYPPPKISRAKLVSFATPDLLLDFVTKHWQERFVTADLPTEAVLDLYSRRPFFLLISVDAPLGVRFDRFRANLSAKAASLSSSECPNTFEAFSRLSDEHLYGSSSSGGGGSQQLALMSRASVRLLNTSSSLAHLYATLGKVDLIDSDRLRPSWDTYFMALASLAARRSNCMKRRVGCVLVRERRVVSTGYNGTPRGLRNCGEGGCARCNDGEGSGHGLSTCLCIHAEENALLEAGRERIREGAILYCDTCPCLTCSIKICQVGIGEVVYSQGYSMDGDTAAVFREAGVRLRQFVPPAQGLVDLEKMD